MLAQILKKLNITFWNTVLTALFLTGLLLSALAVNIYRLTIISPALTTAIWILTGLLITPFTTKVLAEEMKANSIFLQVIYNMATWGGITVYLFLAANFYFTRHDTYETVFQIVNNGNLAKGRNGCGEPYAEIIFEGKEKQLIFQCDTKIKGYYFVQLTLETGLWGYEIIKKQEFKN